VPLAPLLADVEGEGESEAVPLDVPLALAPLGVSVALPLEEPLGASQPVAETVTVALPVRVALPPEADGEGVPLPVRLPLTETETEGVPLELIVEERVPEDVVLPVELGVSLREPLDVALTVDVPLPPEGETLSDTVALPEREGEPEPVGESVSDVVTEETGVNVLLAVELGETDAPVETDGEPLPVRLPDGVVLTVIVVDDVTVPLGETETVELTLLEPLLEPLAAPVRVALAPLAEPDGVFESVGV
jgi:hypothetical protein